MCGIVAVTGYKKALPLLINGLEKLEYRGYDSAGIAMNLLLQYLLNRILYTRVFLNHLLVMVKLFYIQ